MESLNLTTLRKNLYRVVDHILATGIAAEVDRRGKKLLLMPARPVASKLSRLKARKGIVGDPEGLVTVKVGQWNASRNL